MRRISFMLLFLAVSFAVSAQSKREVVRAKVDSVLMKNYNKSNFDTLYMKRPEGKLTLKLRGNLSGNYLKSRYTVSGEKVTAKLNTDTRATLSVAATYLGVTAGVAINPARLSGRNKDLEFNVNAYGNRFGIEANYQLSRTLSGDINYGTEHDHIEKGYLRLANVAISGYYAFNYKHFSYPAAFTQSYIQKRSAGSWLAGFSYSGGSIKTTDEVPGDVPDMRFYVGSFAIGGGYGYNLVAGKWLFHLSAQPNIIVFKTNNVKIDGVKYKESFRFPESIINNRAAIVYNFNQKYFAGTTFISNLSLFGDKDEYTRQMKWLSRVFVGIRL